MIRICAAILIAGAALLAVGCSDDHPPTKSKPLPTIVIDANTVVAEGQTIGVTVSLDPPSGNSVSWTAGVSPLSASAADYNFPVTVVFVGTDTTVFLIPIVNDALVESSELFQIRVNAFTGVSIPAESLVVRIEPSDGGTDVSFSGTVQPLLSGQCAGCHIGSNAGGMNLGSPPTAASVRDAVGSSGPEVFPGLAAQSFLYTKTTATPPVGDQMPPGGPYLSGGEQNSIRDWIDQGCQDN